MLSIHMPSWYPLSFYNSHSTNSLCELDKTVLNLKICSWEFFRRRSYTVSWRKKITILKFHCGENMKSHVNVNLHLKHSAMIFISIVSVGGLLQMYYLSLISHCTFGVMWTPCCVACTTSIEIPIMLAVRRPVFSMFLSGPFSVSRNSRNLSILWFSTQEVQPLVWYRN
jgi:hypothetical protein